MRAHTPFKGAGIAVTMCRKSAGTRGTTIAPEPCARRLDGDSQISLSRRVASERGTGSGANPGHRRQRGRSRAAGAAPAADLPVVMVSAVDDRDLMIEALDHGATDYVAKPLDFDVLLARIRTHL